MRFNPFTAKGPDYKIAVNASAIANPETGIVIDPICCYLRQPLALSRFNIFGRFDTELLNKSTTKHVIAANRISAFEGVLLLGAETSRARRRTVTRLTTARFKLRLRPSSRSLRVA